MFLKKPELTAGSRPSLFQDEALLFVQDGVGLYEGSDICHPKMYRPHAYDVAENTRLTHAKKGTPI